MTKVAIFYVQTYKKNSHVDSYEDYLQEWYDQSKSYGFDKIFYIDDTQDKDVPQLAVNVFVLLFTNIILAVKVLVSVVEPV